MVKESRKAIPTHRPSPICTNAWRNWVRHSWLRDERALAAARLASEGSTGSIVYQAASVVVAAYPRNEDIILNWLAGVWTRPP